MKRAALVLLALLWSSACRATVTATDDSGQDRKSVV
jgi:hypothetical protein